jgi:hypothetical protein
METLENELELLAARWATPHQAYSGITGREHARELREVILKFDTRPLIEELQEQIKDKEPVSLVLEHS